MSEILKKLLSIQRELKAPKNQRNTFGNYNYRSCEDILEAVKPLCQKYGCVLTLSDEVVAVGNRVYVKAGASLIDIETGEGCSNTAFARESETKKGMDDSQITGTASSYARKYAMNGLFCIDDTKDADSNEYHKAAKNAPTAPADVPKIVTCVRCGAEIKGAKKGAQTLSAQDVARQTGGMCIKCFKGAGA